MIRQLALLRGINVGGRNILAMKQLVEHFRSMGARDVQTYIQSGNVVFSAEKRWADREVAVLRDDILEASGFAPSVLILGARELQAAIAANPFPDTDGKSLHFYFLAAEPKQANLARLDALKTRTESVALLGKVFYLRAPDGVGRSRLAPAVESALGVATTARNGNTVEKLASMLGLA